MVRPERFDPTFEMDEFRAADSGALASTPDIVIGKESELLHFSLDLKWLYKGLTNPSSWRALGHSIIVSLKRLHPGFDNEVTYKENALQRLTDLARFNSNLDLRVFGRSLSRAAEVARQQDKLVLVCIEEGEEGLVASSDTLQMHMALASDNCSKMLNENVRLPALNAAFCFWVISIYVCI
ncbi:hypothetical protein EON63_03550 [archaeon]|nr:MAG: hypothetical protein EON63_03550 [archaeon]